MTLMSCCVLGLVNSQIQCNPELTLASVVFAGREVAQYQFTDWACAALRQILRTNQPAHRKTQLPQKDTQKESAIPNETIASRQTNSQYPRFNTRPIQVSCLCCCCVSHFCMHFYRGMWLASLILSGIPFTESRCFDMLDFRLCAATPTVTAQCHTYCHSSMYHLLSPLNREV